MRRCVRGIRRERPALLPTIRSIFTRLSQSPTPRSSPALRRLALLLAVGGLVLSLVLAVRDTGASAAARTAAAFQRAVWAGAADDAYAFLAAAPIGAPAPPEFEDWVDGCTRPVGTAPELAVEAQPAGAEAGSAAGAEAGSPAGAEARSAESGMTTVTLRADTDETTYRLHDDTGVWRVADWTPALPCLPGP